MKITRLYRYPVKGLSAEPLPTVHLETASPLAGDRRYALTTKKDLESPLSWHPKQTFLTLKQHEKLAVLETRFDDKTETLTILMMGKEVARGCLAQMDDRVRLETFISSFMVPTVTDRVSIVKTADDIALTDTEEPFVSLVNLASVRDLERASGVAIDPLRFRANIYFDCDAPWCELDWVDHPIAIGITRLNVMEPTGRCAATNVNPETGLRDHNVVKMLQDGFSHADMGIYATVSGSGDIAVGDSIIF